MESKKEKAKRDKITKQCILYIVKNTDCDRRKLMNLMFLIDHYDLKHKRITLNHTIGNEFYYYK